LHGASFGKLTAVSKLKALDDGNEEWVDPEYSRPKVKSKLEVKLGHLKFAYYLYKKNFREEPRDLIDFYDGLNFIYFYNNPKG
jgi:hypothetical protein